MCFAEPPYFQMTIKPLFNHGLDVTEVPGIAGWLVSLYQILNNKCLISHFASLFLTHVLVLVLYLIICTFLDQDKLLSVAFEQTLVEV